MNVMVDTNIILDDLLNRKPGQETASEVIDRINADNVFGYISANSLTDVYYMVEKKLKERTTNETRQTSRRTL